MSLQGKARQKYSSSPLMRVLRNEDAAIDLASILVGVIVIGLIGGVIAGTVFTVIPWAQDKAAKEQLVSLHSAQNAYYGLSSDPSASLAAAFPRNSFLDSPGLEATGLMSQGSTYCTVQTNNGKDYDSFSKSASGKIFTSSNGNKTPVELPAGKEIAGACSFITDVLGTPLVCGTGKYTPVGNVILTCEQITWPPDRVQHVLTLTPTSATLSHWKVKADLSAVTTLRQVKVSGPSGYSPMIDGVPDMGNVKFLSSKFMVEGNANNHLPESPKNHWYISTAKSPDTILIDIDY
jgi:type II secretory pathway pseudopilin PulG